MGFQFFQEFSPSKVQASLSLVWRAKREVVTQRGIDLGFLHTSSQLSARHGGGYRIAPACRLMSG